MYACTIVFLFKPFSTVPRVFAARTYASYPCIQNEKSEDEWVLPVYAKKYVKEVTLQEWTDYNAKK